MNHSVSEKWPWQTPLPSLLVTHGTFPFILHGSFPFVFTFRLPIPLFQLFLMSCLEPTALLNSLFSSEKYFPRRAFMVLVAACEPLGC